MKLYQAGYYRLGGRGSGSGWKIVAPSIGMSEIAKAGFRGIAARLADLKQNVQMPVQAMGIFRHDRFIYLMHVNYAASGEDSRGVAYVHGYCFNVAEYYELAIHPEILFGIASDQFDLEYRPELSAYPVRESWDYQNMNERKLLDRYHISREQYQKLIFGAICALEGYSSPMCVKCQNQQEQDTQTYRDVMYLIMNGLPYQLRQKLLSFSWQGAQTMLYFSDTVQGENYADLDAGLFRCDDSRLVNYQFLRLYHIELFYSSRDARERAFQNIAEFIERSYVDPLKDAGCAQIEAAFQAKLKKNDDGIEPGKALSLLQEFLKQDICYEKETAEYLANLLDALRQGDVRTLDKKLATGLEDAYGRCADDRLIEPMAWFDAQRILGQKKEEGFQVLMELKSKDANDRYPAVCRYLESMDPDFFADYFWNRFLPSELTSLKKVEYFFKKNGKSFSGKEQRMFQNLLRDLVNHEMEAAGSFEELCMAAQVIERIWHNAPRVDGYPQLWEDTCLMLWNCFQMDWFETDSVDVYQQYNVTKLALRQGQRSSLNAKKVSQLILLTEEARNCTDVHRLWELLYSGQTEEDGKYRKRIRNGIRKQYFSKDGIRKIRSTYASGTQKEIAEQLDISLLLFYDKDRKQFDLVKWIAQWAATIDLEQLTGYWKGYAETSRLLADAVHKKCVILYLEEAFKNKKQTAYNHLSEDEKKALHILYDSLKGRTSGENMAVPFLYSLHREVLGLFVLLTLAMCGICLQRYGSGDIFITMFYAIFLGVGLVMAVMIKAMSGGAIRSQAAGMGLGNALTKCLYVCTPVAFAAAAVLVYVQGGFTQKAICLMVFLAIAAVMVFISGLSAKE